MKYAFMTFSTPDLTLAEVLGVAEVYGYNGVEFRLDAGHKHGVEVAATAAERVALRKRIEASGIAAACLATSIRYAHPDEEHDMLRQTRERIDLAADIGAPAIRVFGGAIPAGMTAERSLMQVAECLMRVSDHAAARNVSVCLETHDDWCAPARVAAVLERVDHPNVGCNWDILHPVRMGFATVEESFRILQPWIRHVHLHDAAPGQDLTLAPIGTGYVDHGLALRCLKGMPYHGFLSGEWINWEPYEVHLPRELATLKALEHEHQAL